MQTPLAVLMLYVLWTLVVLVIGLAPARYMRVRDGARLTDFKGGAADGPPFYNRAMRAHLNCVENLPLYAAVALTAAVTAVVSPVLNTLAVVVLLARVLQSSIHLALPETDKTITFRFLFFAIQVVAIVWMVVVIWQGASPTLTP